MPVISPDYARNTPDYARNAPDYARNAPEEAELHGSVSRGCICTLHTFSYFSP